MARNVLDPTILGKIAQKRGSSEVLPIRKIVSKKASDLGISSEAALVLLAKEHGIGALTYSKRLDPAKQAEIRNVLQNSAQVTPSNTTRNNNQQILRKQPERDTKSILKYSIEILIRDEELKDRCKDLLIARGNYDRAVNQATLILEDRIRRKAKPGKPLTGENLVGFAFNEDTARTVLKVASNSNDDQRGFTQIIRGIVPAFRNKTHHHIIDNITQQEAIATVAFIDVILKIVDNAKRTENGNTEN